MDGGPKNEVTFFWLEIMFCQSSAQNKLAGMYRGPMVITAIKRQDLVKFRCLITNKKLYGACESFETLKEPGTYLKTLIAADLEEFCGEDYRTFWCWKEPQEMEVLSTLAWLRFTRRHYVGLGSKVKDLAALEECSKEIPHLKLG